jgi:hypothetical protein
MVGRATAVAMILFLPSQDYSEAKKDVGSLSELQVLVVKKRRNQKISGKISENFPARIPLTLYEPVSNEERRGFRH